ncbi:MAG: hypothetical protein ACF8OB_04995 [Phycisphaeraceae bacterium JB051]
MALPPDDLNGVYISCRVTFEGETIEVIETQIPTSTDQITLTSDLWPDYFKVWVIDMNLTIWHTGGYSGQAWDGKGYGYKKDRPDGYAMEVAEAYYFTPKTEVTGVGGASTDTTTIEILIAVGIGVLFWQIFARSLRERSVMW